MAHIDPAMVDDYARTGIVPCVPVCLKSWLFIRALFSRQTGCDVVTRR